MTKVTLRKAIDTYFGHFPVGAVPEVPNLACLNSGYVEAVVDPNAAASGYRDPNSFVVLAPGEYDLLSVNA